MLFQGMRMGGIVTVLKNSQEFSAKPSQDVWNHSPCGFEWGYCGSGPAQLALALLLEVTSRDEAVRAHQDFKSMIVAAFPHKQWACTGEGISNWLDMWRVSHPQPTE